MAYYEDIIYDKHELKCTLCSEHIEDKNHLIEAHINSGDHELTELFITLARHSIVVHSNHYYCRVCCELMDILTAVPHIEKSYHEEKLKEFQNIINKDGGFLDYLDRSSKTEKQVDLKCALCDCVVPFEKRLLEEHLATERHRRARAIAVSALNGIFSVEGSKDDLWCKFCKVYFENYIENIYIHVTENVKHYTEYKKILSLIKNKNISIEKYLMDPKEDKAFCNKCDVPVACNVDNLERHIKGKLHNK